MLGRAARTAASASPTRYVPAILARKASALGLGLQDAWMVPMLVGELGTIHHQPLEPCDQPVTSTTDYEFLCSYTWGPPKTAEVGTDSVQRLQPTICIPGDAPRVLLHNLPKLMPTKTTHTTYRDANIARFKSSPWRPMFRALEIMKPGYKLDDVDLIINRNVLQTLLLFADGRRKENFRLDIAMIENTLLVTPFLRSAFEGRRNGSTHGRLFEQAFTKNASEEQAHGSHHRAIRYNIGPLSCVVLFECDAQIDDSALKMTKKPHWLWLPPPEGFGGQALHDKVVQQLRPQFEKERARFNRITKASINTPQLKGYTLPFNTIHDGQGTLSSQLAELTAGKTRMKTRQMWLGRTPYLVCGRRCQNSFTNINIKPAWPHLLAFEKGYQESLRRLVSVIRLLKHFASHAPSQTCAAVCAGPDRSLRMFSLAGKKLKDGHEGFQKRFWTQHATTPPKRPPNKIYPKKATSARSKGISIIAQQRARNAALYSFKIPIGKVPNLAKVDGQPPGQKLKRSITDKQPTGKIPKPSIDDSLNCKHIRENCS